MKPSKVLPHASRPTFEQLPFQNLLPEQGTDEIEEQYKKILLQPWNEEVFQSRVPNNPVQIWAAVRRFQYTTGFCPYKDLATYALACFSTPVSNALVERVFSHVNAVKTDKRNRMGLKMVEYITKIRITLVVKNKCYKDFVVTKEMLHRFNSNMYETLVVKNKCFKDFVTKK